MISDCNNTNPTPWRQVRQGLLLDGSQAATNAWRLLVQRYSPAVRKYVGDLLHHSEDTEVVAQDLITRLLRGDLGGVDLEQERFRDLLRSAIRSMLGADDRDNHQQTSGIELDDVWQQCFRLTLLDHVWAVLKGDEAAMQGSPFSTVLKMRLMHPEDTSEQLATRLSVILGTPIRPEACRQLLRRARLKFAETLVDEIRLGLANPGDDEVRSELVALDLFEYVEDVLPLGKRQ